MSGYLGLVTSGHRSRPRFMATVAAVTDPLCELQDLLESMRAAFDVDSAVGEQLDHTGEWLGRSRHLRLELDDVYFEWGREPILEATGATPVALPAVIPAGHVARWNGGAWETVEDHRRHMDERGRKEGGTPYWLPGDTWRSEPRYTEELGPLPAGALLAKPEKSAEELEQEARTKIKGQLAALDAKYLTPRTLAGLAVGDEYALEQWRAHEAEAEPFRMRLAAL